MTMTPKDYEQVVSDIARGIQDGAADLSNFKLGYGAKNRIRGTSGYRHQIDVSLVSPERVYLIECKLWGRKVGVAEILTLAARAADIGALRSDLLVDCILASNAGPTRGAKKLIAHFGIQVEAVKSASEFGFKLGKNIHLGVVDVISPTGHVTSLELRSPKDSKE